MLDKLTPEQEARLPEFREFGLRIGLSTERTDRVAAEAAIRAHYRACGLDEPREIRWFDSPYASAGASVGDSVRASVWDSAGASVGDSVRASVWDSVGASVGGRAGASVWVSVRDSVGGSVWASVWASVGARVRDSVRDSVRDIVRDIVGGRAGASVRDSVRDIVGDSVGASVWASVRAIVWDSVGAHYDADDVAWMLAWDQYGVSLPASALTLIEVSRNVWWWYPGREIVFASDRPTAIHRDDAGRLHCETGKAIEFADGTGLSAWHGRTIPDEWVRQRHTIDPREILQHRDVEVKAAGLRCIGYHRVFDELNGRVIHDSGSAEIGQLVELQIPGLPQPGRFLRAQCPRNGQIFEGIPTTPDINTAYAAQAWREGLTPEEWAPPPVRT